MTVQYSIQKMVSDGTLSTIALGIQYLQRNDIYMRIAGVDTPQSGAPSGYTWSFIDNTTLKILPVVPNGIEVVVYRRTDANAMYNVYSQNAQFDEATIDENNQQLLYIAQEYLEQGLPGTGVDTIEYVRDDGSFTYYRMRRTDGSYSEEFTVPSASNSTKVLTRESLRRSYAEAGYNLVDGSFEAGGTLVNANDVLLQERTGKAFTGPAGAVVAGTNPVGGGFVDVSGVLLFNSAIESIRRYLASIGLNLAGSFEIGCTLNKPSDVVIHFSTGLVYRYAGPFPHTVAKDTSPSTAGFTDIQVGFTAAATQQLVDNFTLKKVGGVPPTITVPAGTAYISGSGSERADIDRVNLLGDGKAGTDGTMGVHWFGDVSSNQPIRNRITNFRIGSMKTAGIRMSAGWGNLIAEGRIIDIGGNGLDIVGSPILSGWGGSGSVVRNLYAANCGIGISNFTGWCFTFINPVLEYNETPFRERGNNALWINPWLEGNTNPPLIERGTVILCGRGVSYRATLPGDLSSFEPLEAVTRIHNRGIQVFRDDTDRVFDVDGEGVKRIRSKTTAGLPLDGAITSFDSNRRNGFNVKCITNNTSPLIKTNPRNVSGIKGVATADSADGGSHYGRVVLYSGVIGSTQNTVADRWEVRFDGAFHPATDNAVTVGRASERPSVIYAATGTINTSDGREKTEIRQFDDAFLDAVDDIEIGLYQWLAAIGKKGNDAARKHTGVIAQQVRDAFSKQGIDATEYGLLCYDEWEDEWEDIYVDVEHEISDSEGNLVGFETIQEPTGERRLLTAAGNRWGLRESQVHWALHAASRRRSVVLEQRLALIEATLGCNTK